MKEIAIVALLFIHGTVFSQELVEAIYLGSTSKSETTAATSFPAQYALDYYKVLYTTLDVNGMPDTASGLMAVPQFAGNLPLLCYQHGTTDGKYDVPSNIGVGDAQTGLYASQGYLSIAPDYIGMGESRGFHPYVHAATEASAGADMIAAVAQWLTTEPDLAHNGQVFVTGYSQGGHASMALHKLLEESSSNPFEVTAASHMSGPYSISEKMVGQALSPEPYLFVAYFAYTTMSYQTAYGNLYDDIGEVFKAPYVEPIREFYTNFENGASLFDLNSELISLLNQNVGASVPFHMIQDSIRTVLELQPDDHPIIQALRDNDLYEWAPEAPTRILYCQGDDQVPYTNSTLADSVMNALGAADLVTINLNPNFNHGQCVPPAFLATLGFFNQFASVTTDTDMPIMPRALAYPNPVTTTLYLQLPPASEPVVMEMTDLQGRHILSKDISPQITQIEIPVSHLRPGMYLIQLHYGSFSEVIRVVKHQ